MSIFWGVYLPPPQKYTSLERVVTTATGVSLTVLSLGRKNNEISKKTASNLSRDVSTCACEVTYLGLFIAEFSRTTRSSSSLNTSKGEFWVNRMERIFSIHFFFFFCVSTHCRQQEMKGWSRTCSAVGLFAGSCHKNHLNDRQVFHRKSSVKSIKKRRECSRFSLLLT